MAYTYRKSHKKKKLIIPLILILALIALIVFFILPNFLFQTVLTTGGFVQMRVNQIMSAGETTIVRLKGECSQMDIYIAPWQALAIQEGLQDTSYRPDTHDILVDIIEGHGINPMMVKITKLQDRTYLAELYLQSWNRLLILDIRPSDAIAVAVRTNTPIYANENLVTKVC